MMKDNLIDEEKAKQEEAAQESLEQKIDRLGTRFIFSTQLHQAINYCLILQILLWKICLLDFHA